MEWTRMSLAEQLGNVGSEFDRAVRWRQKNQARLAMNAALRALDQLDRTLSDERHAGPPRKELARLRDEVCKELFENRVNNQSSYNLQKYFLSMAILAQRNKGR